MPTILRCLLPVLGIISAATAAETAIPRIASILAIGDSITRHGPSAELGWTGDWGMAASAREKDWAHLLQAQVTAHQGGTAPTLLLDAAGGGRIRDKLANLAAITAQHADLIIVQLGENENNPELIAGFEHDYAALVSALRAANPQSRLICLGVWGGDGGKDAIIHRICAAQGAWFASIAADSADPANRAKADQRWAHPGVNWHPGDRGMAAYAATVWRVLGHGSDSVGAVAAAGTTAVISEDFADPAAVAARWHGGGAADAGAWRIVLAEPGGSALSTQLPLAQVGGHRVHVTARVRAAGVTTRPKPWNGIKVQLAITDAEAHKDWPQATVADGSFDWTPVEFYAFIPGNAVRVDLNLGLESVAGSVWFDDVRVEALAP